MTRFSGIREAVRGLLAVLVLGWLVTASTASPPTEQQPRVDAFGDPLPKHAIARIGTVRFRQPSDILSVAFSPDGKLLATGGDDCTRLWDATTGKVVRRLAHPQVWDGVAGMSFSPDGRWLISSGYGVVLQVWDVVAGKEACQLKVETDDSRLRRPTFSPDGKLLAAAGEEATHVWRTADWKRLATLPGHAQQVFQLSFSRDSKRLIVGDEAGKVCFWDLASRDKQVFRTGHCGEQAAALSPEGQRIAFVPSDNSAVLVRNVKTRKEQARIDLKKTARVNELRFSPDGRLLALTGRGTGIRLHDADTGKAVARFGEEEVSFTQLAFSPDGNRLAAASGQGVRTWDIATRKELLPTSELLHGVQVVAFSPDGKQLAFGDSTWLWLYETATRRRVWRIGEERRDYSTRITFAPDGKMLAAGNVALLRFHDAATGRMTHSIGKRLPHCPPWIDYLLPHPDLASVACLQIANRETSPLVCVRKANTGKALFEFQRKEGPATAASISPDGRLLAIGYLEAPIQLLQLGTGNTMAQLTVPKTDFYRLNFAPDSRMLASVDEFVRLLEVSTGGQRLAFEREVDTRLAPLVFSPNGNVLVTWGESTEHQTVYLWDTYTGRAIGHLDGHEGEVNHVAFSPDGKTMATASSDATILLWDVAEFVQRARSVPLSPQALATAWDDLASPDSARAYRAMASLHQAGAQTVEFLRGRLRVEQAPTPEQLGRWLKDLDHDDFAVRERRHPGTGEAPRCGCARPAASTGRRTSAGGPPQTDAADRDGGNRRLEQRTVANPACHRGAGASGIARRAGGAGKAGGRSARDALDGRSQGVPAAA